MDFNRDFLAENIKRLRDEKGWTQEALAEKAGLTTLTISNYERKQRDGNPRTIHKIAVALGVSPASLLKNPIEATEPNHRMVAELAAEAAIKS